MAWGSKTQRSMALSSSEAKWVPLSKAVKDIIFIIQLLKMMKIKVKFPVIVRVDNTEAIFMGKNVTKSLQTKHVDSCTKYVCEYVEDEIMKIVFIWSEDNTSDIMMKNIQGNLCNEHSSQLVVARP